MLSDTLVEERGYYKLRDLGVTMGFEVGWSAEKCVYVNTPVYG